MAVNNCNILTNKYLNKLFVTVVSLPRSWNNQRSLNISLIKRPRDRNNCIHRLKDNTFT